MKYEFENSAETCANWADAQKTAIKILRECAQKRIVITVSAENENEAALLHSLRQGHVDQCRAIAPTPIENNSFKVTAGLNSLDR